MDEIVNGRASVEILCFDGCPHRRATVSLVREVAAELRVQVDICEVAVGEGAEAERLRFLGSPTVRVNGADIDPDAAARSDYALACRLYGASGVPPRKMVAAAFRAAGPIE